MSTPSGGHAVHLTGSGREQQNAGPGGGGGKSQKLLKHQPQLIGNGAVPQQLAGNVQAHGAPHLHSHTELDHRVLGGHHGPPPKVEAIGMMEAWTRMAPQYASQAAHTPLEPQFISSSPAAYYHAPVSPYGATYAGLGNDSTHAGAPWSNGTDVASYFGYPGPASAEFHHPESMSIPALFGNGYPAGTYGAPSTFGYSPFTPTHTAPGPAVSQDYAGWGATTAHDLLDRGSHQKNLYGDYYSYELMGATPNIIGPSGAPLEMGGGPIPINCEESMKRLGNQMETLTMAPMGQGLVFSHGSDQLEHQVEETRPVEICAVTFETESEHLNKLDGTDELKSRHLRQDSTVNDQNEVHTSRITPVYVEAADNLLTVKVPMSHTATGPTTVPPPKNSSSHYNVENNNNNNGDEVTITDEEFVQSRALASPHPSNTVDDPSSSDTPQLIALANEDKNISEDTENQEESSDSENKGVALAKQTGPINISNWNWIAEEVKDWSASPPPPPLSHSPESTDLSLSQERENITTVNDEASAHLLHDLIRENRYNPKTFDGSVDDARFFVIKSYSEDDVHRSIKYSIWCSTEHGNKKLDQAFRHQKNSGGGAIYLFYSVNTSGHFCGMAQMTSSVDTDTLTGVWAQDKWKGKFNVKWIYVKDIPNIELRHIRLENNENKPVTNSRDTQEIPPMKGRQVLNIMHGYRHVTSLLDDFAYYEEIEQQGERGRENQQGFVQTCSSSVAKDRNSPSSGARSVSRITPKRKDHVDDVREGHSSNGNHRDNHHLKDYHHRDMRDRNDSRNQAAPGVNSRSFGGASGSSSGSYNHNHRDGNSRGFGYRGEDRGNHSGRSFTNFRRNSDRDREYSRDGGERTFFSNRSNTSRTDTTHWR